MDYAKIQQQVILQYGIIINEHSTCYRRTHAHRETRTICKWKQENTFKSTFTLLHEIGHIVNNNSKMRRAEQEYYATTWAIDKCKEYGIKIPRRKVEIYQRYIILEIARGERRGGTEYKDLNILDYAGFENEGLRAFYETLPMNWKMFINWK